MNRYHYTVEEFLMNSLLVGDLHYLSSGVGGGGIIGGSHGFQGEWRRISRR